MKSRKKFINAIVAVACAAVLSVGAFIGIASNRPTVSAQAEETQNLSYEEYARLLYINQLKPEEKPQVVIESPNFTRYDKLSYNKQKSNNWGYLSLACKAASWVLPKVVPASLILRIPAIGKLAGLGTKGLVAGSNFFLREMMLEKVGDSTAEMLNKTIDVLNETIYTAFSDLNTQINKQTETLNDSIEKSKNDIINAIVSESRLSGYKTLLDKFNTVAFNNKSSNGNVGYYAWVKNLNNIFASVSSTAKQSVYDNLYFVSAIADTVLYEYIVGSMGDSILETLYKYYLLANAKDGKFGVDNGLYNCLQFADNLYNSYLLGNTCLQLAYIYQSEMFKGEDYAPENNTNIYVPFNEVVEYYNNLEYKMKKVEQALLKFYVRILGLNESFTYAGSDGTVYGDVIYSTLGYTSVPFSSRVTLDNAATESGKFITHHNSVKQGDIIYLQEMPSSLISSLNTGVYFKSSDEELATVTENGVVTVKGESGSFDISLVTGEEANDVIYSRTFNVGVEAFSGGFGTEAVPYRISDANDLKYLADHSQYWIADCHFVLTSDINLSGISIGKIGTEGNPFKGVLDGNNHVISNKSGDALFETIGGTVKNLTLFEFTIKGYNFTADNSINSGDFYGGIMCLHNRGTIENCHIINSSVKGDQLPRVKSDGNTYFQHRLFYGAIAANYGTVINSSAINVNVSTSFISEYNGYNFYTNVYNYSGALIGFNNANTKTTDCLAANNDVYSKIHNRSKCDGYGDSHKLVTTAYFIMGGLVGECHQAATVNRSIAYSNYVHGDWQGDKDITVPFGKVDVKCDGRLRQFAGTNYGTMTSCYSDEPTTDFGLKDAAITSMSEQDKTAFIKKGWDFTNGTVPTLNGAPVLQQEVDSITAVLPIKTTYYSGEELNLAGLSVLSDKGQVLSNVKVTLLDTLTLAENQKEKDVQVQVMWNDLTTTFNVKVSCPHDYVEDKNQRVEATCVTEGKKVYICQVTGCNDTKTIKTEATGHSYKEVVTEATCVSDGYTTHSCELCGDSYVDNEVPALGHSYADEVVTVTCTTDGYNEHTCSRCGYSYRDNEVPALGHNMVYHAGKSPTCTEVGWYAYDACSRGDNTTYREIAALGHVWGDWAITKSPTCTAAGERRRICNRDDTHVDTGAVDPLGHYWGEWNQLAAPTCTEAGQKQRICVHNNAHKDNEAIPALGHAWGEWIETKPVTCTEDGHEYRICGRVNEHREDRDITALGHDTVHHEAKAPTYTEKGWKAYDDCNRCDYTTYQELEALGLAQKFKDEVASIESNPLGGIKAALTTYATLTSEDKEKVTTEYAKLEKAITAYNQKAEKLNESYENALSVAIKATASAVAAISALAAAAFVLGKKG